MSENGVFYYVFVGLPVVLVAMSPTLYLNKKVEGCEELLTEYAELKSSIDRLNRERSSLQNENATLKSQKEQQDAIFRKLENFWFCSVNPA